jgi:GGDEF domain-containing protein
VLWLSFLFNVERIDVNVGNSNISNIASPIYVVTVLVVLLGILLPQWKRVPLWSVNLIAVIAFVAALVIDRQPFWGDIQTFVTLFELMAVVLSATLSYQVGRLSADFVETAHAMMFVDLDGRVYGADEAEPVIKREMQSSRRSNRPLSVMVLDAKADSEKINLQETAREIQNILVKRQSMVALARLLPRALRRTDFVLHEVGDGRLVVVMPELRKEQTGAIINRLTQVAQRRLGLSVQYGIASFPDNGVTFEELVYQAEQNLEPSQDVRRIEGSVDRRESTTEKLPVA